MARAYVQGALPGVPYRGDVDRLITIGAPHMGCALAEYWGSFLGPQATTLKPSAPFIKNLNETFDLPSDVHFASIVVRALGSDPRGEGKKFEALVNHEVLDRLPPEYAIGGDDIVHVRSQNLRLTACGERYEQRTGRPLQYFLARVVRPRDLPWPLKSAHCEALQDSVVQSHVRRLLDDDQWWTGIPVPARASWEEQAARLHIRGAIEAEVLRKHPVSNVREIKLSQCDLARREGDATTWTFAGEAFSVNSWLGFRRRWTEVRGSLDLEFDRFGRVLLAGRRTERVQDR